MRSVKGADYKKLAAIKYSPAGPDRRPEKRPYGGRTRHPRRNADRNGTWSWDVFYTRLICVTSLAPSETTLSHSLMSCGPGLPCCYIGCGGPEWERSAGERHIPDKRRREVGRDERAGLRLGKGSARASRKARRSPCWRLDRRHGAALMVAGLARDVVGHRGRWGRALVSGPPVPRPGCCSDQHRGQAWHRHSYLPRGGRPDARLRRQRGGLLVTGNLACQVRGEPPRRRTGPRGVRGRPRRGPGRVL